MTLAQRRGLMWATFAVLAALFLFLEGLYAYNLTRWPDKPDRGWMSSIETGLQFPNRGLRLLRLAFRMARFPRCCGPSDGAHCTPEYEHGLILPIAANPITCSRIRSNYSAGRARHKGQRSHKGAVCDIIPAW